MRINTNINAMIATNQMTKNTALSGASMEKLSTGLRITKAGDDAAGLAISEKMRAQIRGMEQADRNVQDGISMVQTAEGAMEEIGNITQRMRELAVQASNETNSTDDRTKITEELTQLKDEITRIADNTKFNGENILSGGGTGLSTNGALKNNVTNFKVDSSKIGDFNSISISFTSNNNTLSVAVSKGNTQATTKTVTLDETTFRGGTVNIKDLGISFDIKLGDSENLHTAFGTAKKDTLVSGTGAMKEVSLQVGSNTNDNDKLKVNIDAMNADALGITDASINNIVNATDKAAGTKAANKLINTLDEALNKVNTSRSNLGSQQNRLEYTSSNLTTSTENLTAAESRIRDVDVAKEMVKLSKLNILNQASQAMVSQAKQQPESVSQLLR